MKAKPERTGNWSIVFPVGAITGILLLCKFIGFTEKIVVARYLGTGLAADSYFAVMSLVWTIVFALRELVELAFLPVYVGIIQRGDSESHRGLFSLMTYILIGMFTVIAVLLFCWPTPIVSLVVPGFSTDLQVQTAALFKSVIPGIVLLSIMGYTRVVLNAHLRFGWAAWGELVFRIILVGGIVAGFILSNSLHLGWAVAAGATAAILLHWIALIKHTRFQWSIIDPDTLCSLRQVSILAAPLIIGVIFSHISQLFDNILASTLSAGRLSALSYAKKLIDAILLVGPIALGTVLFSRFSALMAAERVDEMKAVLIKCIRVILIVSVPVSLLVVSLRYPIVQLLFERGRFNQESTSLTAGALAYYGCGIAALALEGIVVVSFFALKDAKTPVIVGICSSVMDVGLAWFLMRFMDHLGIALSLSLTKTAKVLILGVLLHNRMKLQVGRQLCGLIVRLAAIAVTMLLAIQAVMMACEHGFVQPNPWVQIFTVGMAGTVGLIVYFAVACAIRIPETRQVLSLIQNYARAR